MSTLQRRYLSVELVIYNVFILMIGLQLIIKTKATITKPRYHMS